MEEVGSLLEVSNFVVRPLEFLVIVTLRKALKIAKVMIVVTFHNYSFWIKDNKDEFGVIM